jgi:hypothetical protein
MYNDNKKLMAAVILCFVSHTASAQATYDSTSLVDTNNTNTTTVNSTSNNTNTNTNTTTSNNTNTNTDTVTSTSTVTSNNTNNNTNINQSTSTQTIDSVNRNDNNNRNDTRMRIEQPPPTAVAPAMMSGGNNDLCTTGVSGAVQTQILGISGGGTVRDMNCERLKLAKTLYDMGMKVAAVSTLCQDNRVWTAMWAAGTPCPYDGKIGAEARELWAANPDRIPRAEKAENNDTKKNMGIGIGIGALLMLLL